MARPIDYSKWLKGIDISDDEDDVHPNIDTPSLFRWRHDARLNYQRELAEKKEKALNEHKEVETKLEEYKALGSSASKVDLESMTKKIQELQSKIEEFEREEQQRPWNIDTISKEVFSKTQINKPCESQSLTVTEEERKQEMCQFVKTHENDIKEFGMIQSLDESMRFLLDKKHLVCDATANYLVLWCIELAMEAKYNQLEYVAHQTMLLQHMFEMAKVKKADPRDCIGLFFIRMKEAGTTNEIELFKDVAAFKARVLKKAKEKLEEIQEDPMEVLNSLPSEMQECFNEQDADKLRAVVAAMPEDEARQYMRRCIASGLWVPTPDPNTNPEDGFAIASEDDGTEDEENSTMERKVVNPITTEMTQ